MAKWVATWTDPATGTRRFVRCRTRRDRDALQRRMRDIAWQVKHGLMPPAAIGEAERAGRPIGELLEEYQGHLEALGRTPAYVRTTLGTLRRIAAEAGWATPADIDARRLDQWLKSQDVTQRTRAAYAKAWRAVTSWASGRTGGWFTVDPLASVKPTTTGEQASLRRGLTVAEYDALIASSDRAEDYILLCHTGLRWTEAAALTMADVRLDTGVLIVPVGIGKTDADRESHIPIPALVSEMLAARRRVGVSPLLTRPRPDSRVWPRELKAAGLTRQTAAGKLVPASMRATYSTWLAASGCSDEDRHRLRRDAGDIAERRYTDQSQIVERLRGAVDGMVRWCSAERLKARVG